MYTITEKAKDIVKNTIRNTLHNNEYDKNLINNPPVKNKNKIHTLIHGTKKQSWLPSHIVVKK
jgi:hypothetical protein